MSFKLALYSYIAIKARNKLYVASTLLATRYMKTFSFKGEILCGFCSFVILSKV